MFTVVLVDDEIWSLEGLRKLFAWEQAGFKVIAQLTDASEAFEFICTAKPDVVITDIRMPELSGVELLTRSRQQGVQSEFVIISGFAEFEYAQEALRYGAFDYQLKPIDPGDAKQLLTKLRFHLEEKRMERDMKTVKELTTGLINPSDWLQAAGGNREGAVWQVAVCFALPGISGGEAAALCSGMNPIILKPAFNKIVLITNGDRPIEKELRSVYAGGTELRHWYIGLSGISDDKDQLPRLIKEAGMAAARYFIEERPGFAEFSASSSFRIESFIIKLEKLLMLKNYSEIGCMLDGLPAVFIQHNLGVYHAACLWNQLAAMTGKRLEVDHATVRMDFLDYEEIVARFHDLSSMCAHIGELLKQICLTSGSGTAKSNHYNGNIIALLDYVNGNYNKELVLSELADKFYLNMSYCSELFKKVTGYTFSDYVTKLRMEAAAELIQSGNYTANRVCHMTGYNDYYYFSKIFKRFHGISPSQFTGKTMQLSSTGFV